MATAPKTTPNYFEVPSVTTSEKNAITPSDYMLVYDNTIGALHIYEGGMWHGIYDLIVDFNLHTTTPITLTAQPNSERILGNSNNHRLKLDLSGISQFRLVVEPLSTSASPNNPRIYAQYSTDDSTYVDLASGTNPTASLSVAPTVVDSGWTDMNLSASIDNIFIRMADNGGDGTSSPTIGRICLMFR